MSTVLQDKNMKEGSFMPREFEMPLPPHERHRGPGRFEPTHEDIMRKLEEIEELLRKG